MSMNIHISGVGEAIYPNGKKYPVVEIFNVLQTPTTITNDILKSEDKLAKYKEWVMLTYGNDEQEEILDYDDWDSETSYYRVIGHKIINYGRDHCEKLDKFVEDIIEKGLILEIYSL